jgi:hypothetical protein
MKKILLFAMLLTLTHFMNAQVYVSTNPENKKAILEEFTGTGCPNCPGGHTMAANILAANPGNVFVIADHPTNSSYTTTDPMKNTYPNAFYTIPFISPSNRYMPSAIINRRVWGGVERIQGTGSWTADVATIMSEASPLNVGLSSSYDDATHLLTLTAEVYYTADVTDPVTLYTFITEDGIIAAQSGGTSPYTHNHVFRAAIPQPSPAQWGEPITGPTTTGSLTTVNYTYDNTTTNYDMLKCEVVVFVRNASNEEIISGNGAAVGYATGVSQPQITTGEEVTVFPNPVTVNSKLRVNVTKSDVLTYEINNAMGQVVKRVNLGRLDAGAHQVPFDTESLSKGLYMMTVYTGTNSTTVKFIK